VSFLFQVSRLLGVLNRKVRKGLRYQRKVSIATSAKKLCELCGKIMFKVSQPNISNKSLLSI